MPGSATYRSLCSALSARPRDTVKAVKRMVSQIAIQLPRPRLPGVFESVMSNAEHERPGRRGKGNSHALDERDRISTLAAGARASRPCVGSSGSRGRGARRDARATAPGHAPFLNITIRLVLVPLKLLSTPQQL